MKVFLILSLFFISVLFPINIFPVDKEEIVFMLDDNQRPLTDEEFDLTREEFEGIPLEAFVINGDAKLLFLPLLFRKFLKLFVSNNRDLVNSKGNTLLHMAAYLCEEWCVKLCLFYGIDVNAKNKVGATPLDFVISIDNNYEQATSRLKIATLLRKNGGKKSEELSNLPLET